MISAPKAVQQILHAADRDVEVGGLSDRDLTAAEREQLPGQPRGPLRHAPDLFDGFPQRTVARNLLRQFVAVAEQHGDQVVEVVRDAARQPPDRFHLLGLPQLRFELVAIGHVARDHGDPDNLTIIDQHLCKRLDRDPRAPPRHDLGPHRARRRVGALLEHPSDGLDVSLVEEPIGVDRPRFLPWIPAQLLSGPVHRRNAAAPVVHDDDIGGAIEEVIELCLERSPARGLPLNGAVLGLKPAVDDRQRRPRREHEQEGQGQDRTGSFRHQQISFVY